MPMHNRMDFAGLYSLFNPILKIRYADIVEKQYGNQETVNLGQAYSDAFLKTMGEYTTIEQYFAMTNMYGMDAYSLFDKTPLYDRVMKDID